MCYYLSSCQGARDEREAEADLWAVSSVRVSGYRATMDAHADRLRERRQNRLAERAIDSQAYDILLEPIRGHFLTHLRAEHALLELRAEP